MIDNAKTGKLALSIKNITNLAVSVAAIKNTEIIINPIDRALIYSP